MSAVSKRPQVGRSHESKWPTRGSQRAHLPLQRAAHANISLQRSHGFGHRRPPRRHRCKLLSGEIRCWIRSDRYIAPPPLARRWFRSQLDLGSTLTPTTFRSRAGAARHLCLHPAFEDYVLAWHPGPQAGRLQRSGEWSGLQSRIPTLDHDCRTLVHCRQDPIVQVWAQVRSILRHQASPVLS